MHLEITQNTGVTEHVANSVVSKLYELAYDEGAVQSVLDNSSTIEGSISVAAAYDTHIDYLATKFPNLHITPTSLYIKFADPVVEPVLIAQGYSADGVGITTSDVASIRLADSLFYNNASIQTFDELSQFRNLSIGNTCFKGCTNLASVSLSAATNIGNECFYDCSSLAIDVNAPNLVTLGYGVFRNSGITSISNLGSLSSIPANCFRNCTSLTTAVLPSTTSTFNEFSFAYNPNLTQITGLSSGVIITLNGSYVFGGCNSLQSIGCDTFEGKYSSSDNKYQLLAGVFADCYELEGELNFPNVQLIDQHDYFRQFNNCRKITKITIGHADVVGGGNQYSGDQRGMFTGCSLLKIVDLGDSLLYIKDRYSFRGCTSLKAIIIRNSTPPQICPNDANATSYSFSDIFGPSADCRIYVPDAAVATYKSATWFDNNQDKILPISDYNESAIMGN